MKIALYKDDHTAVVLTQYWLDGREFLTVENTDKTWAIWSGSNCQMFESVDQAANSQQIRDRVAYDRDGRRMGRIGSIGHTNVLVYGPTNIWVFAAVIPMSDVFVKIKKNEKK